MITILNLESLCINSISGLIGNDICLNYLRHEYVIPRIAVSAASSSPCLFFPLYTLRAFLSTMSFRGSCDAAASFLRICCIAALIKSIPVDDVVAAFIAKHRMSCCYTHFFVQVLCYVDIGSSPSSTYDLSDYLYCSSRGISNGYSSEISLNLV